VKVGGVEVPSFSIVDDETITATVPYIGSSGSLTIQVTAPFYKASLLAYTAPALWTPASMSAALLLQWLDGTAGITESGGSISAWADQSTHGRDLAQASGANQPTYAGSNTVEMTSAQNMTGDPHIFSAIRGGSGRHVFRVAAGPDGEHYNFYESKAAGSGWWGWGATPYGFDGAAGDARAFGSAKDNSGAYRQLHYDTVSDIYDGTQKIYSYEDLGDAQRSYVNGVLDKSQAKGWASGAYSGWDTLAIGALYVGGSVYGGEISVKQFVVTAELSERQRQRVEGFMSWKTAGDGSYLPVAHPYKAQAPLAAEEWTPAELITQIWLDAQNDVVESGGAVSSWGDRSGNSFDYAQASASNQPTLQATGLNGKPVIYFDGSEHLARTNSGTPSGAWTWFAVVNHTEALEDEYLFDAQTHRPVVGMRGNVDGPWYSDSATMVDSGDVAYGIQVISWEMAANGDIYRNGTSIASPTHAGATPNLDGASAIPARYDGTLEWKGSIAEFIICPGELSTADRQKVEGYLAWRWTGGTTDLVAALPVSHPFKTAAPTVSD
jgi:hypothetical protein